jgi:hypothetical protein
MERNTFKLDGAVTGPAWDMLTNVATMTVATEMSMMVVCLAVSTARQQ